MWQYWYLEWARTYKWSKWDSKIHCLWWNKGPPSLPAFVLVKFPKYTGPSFHPKEAKIVPIVPVLRKWHDSRVEHNRTMLPITPSYAITIHKSQGQTLNKVILNLWRSEFASGLTYTAISRATKLENIAFYPEFPTYARFSEIFSKKRFKEWLDEEERLRKLVWKLSKTCILYHIFYIFFQ